MKVELDAPNLTYFAFRSNLLMNSSLDFLSILLLVCSRKDCVMVAPIKVVSLVIYGLISEGKWLPVFLAYIP